MDCRLLALFVLVGIALAQTTPRSAAQITSLPGLVRKKKRFLPVCLNFI
jgi:hypothetical protein